MQTSVLIIAHLSPIACSCNCLLLSRLYGGQLQVTAGKTGPGNQSAPWSAEICWDNWEGCFDSFSWADTHTCAHTYVSSTLSSLTPEHHLVVEICRWKLYWLNEIKIMYCAMVWSISIAHAHTCIYTRQASTFLSILNTQPLFDIL